jgi:hypothetical protein
MHGARAALPVIAALLRAGDTGVLAKRVEERVQGATSSFTDVPLKFSVMALLGRNPVGTPETTFPLERCP